MTPVRNFRKLLHLPPGYAVSGELTFMLDLIKALKEYTHVILFKDLPVNEDMDIARILQSTGADVLFGDTSLEVIATQGAGAAIVYDNANYAGIGDIVPTIYYATRTCDAACKATIYVIATANTMRFPGLDDVVVIPPGINTRSLRHYIKTEGMFTVGILSTSDKYPDTLISYVLRNAPKDILICVTTLDKYKDDVVPSAIEYRKNGNVIFNAPLKFTAGINYLHKCDVLLHTVPDIYGAEYYSRTVVESMALGRPVIFDDKGWVPKLFEEHMPVCAGHEAMLAKAIELQKDKEQYAKLSRAAQLRASWQDISLYSERIRQVLRMVGV